MEAETYRFDYTNSTDRPVTVTIELWAEEYMVHPGQTIRITFIGRRSEGLDIDLTIEDGPYGPIFFPECRDFSVTSKDGRKLIPFHDEPPPRAMRSPNPSAHLYSTGRSDGVVSRLGRMLRRLRPGKADSGQDDVG